MTVLRNPRRVALLSASLTLGLGTSLTVLMTAGGATAYATPNDVLPTTAPAPAPTLDPTTVLAPTTDVPLPLSSPSASPTDTPAPADTTSGASSDTTSGAASDTSSGTSSDSAASAPVTTAGGTSSGAQAAASTGQVAGTVVKSSSQQTAQKLGNLTGVASSAASSAHLPSVTTPRTGATAMGTPRLKMLAAPGMSPVFLPPVLGQTTLSPGLSPLLAPPALSTQSLTTGTAAGSTATAQLSASHSSTPGGAPVVMAGLCGLVALVASRLGRTRRRAIARQPH